MPLTRFQLPMGNLWTRWRPSSTTTMAPASSLVLDWSKHVFQAFDDMVRSRVVEAEQDDADHLPG
jgi:hypothetical protein